MNIMFKIKLITVVTSKTTSLNIKIISHKGTRHRKTKSQPTKANYLSKPAAVDIKG